MKAAHGAHEKRLERGTKWKWIGLGTAILGLLILARVLPVADWLFKFNDRVAHLGLLGVLLFMLVYVAATVLLFPASILTIGAGFIFGVVSGTLIVSIAATAGAALAFLTARYLARNQVETRFAGNPAFKRIDRAIGERGAGLIFLLRLSPLVPFNVSNYIYGLTSVKFWPYVLASWVGMLPGTLLYVYLGTAGRLGLGGAVGRSSAHSIWEYALFGVGLLATIVVTVLVTRIARKELSKTEVNSP
jgi:uncharacterized membrane protein YdjX (TVP38/TMEM64 family)